MKRLKYFGMPVCLKEDTCVLEYDKNAVTVDDYKRKTAREMSPLLYSCGLLEEEEPYYDFYRALRRVKDAHIFREHGVRFDSTVIFPGKTGAEFKKTAGHFHNNIACKRHSYPELYQVITGQALFIMQKVISFEAGEPMRVEDLLLAEVKSGQTIVVPPDYGHATVNTGKTPMVFVNLISEQCTNYYDSVAASEGMSVFVLDDGHGGYMPVKNKKYVCDIEPRIVVPADCEALCIRQKESAYRAFTARPERFAYLSDPLPCKEKFMGVFAEKAAAKGARAADTAVAPPVLAP